MQYVPLSHCIIPVMEPSLPHIEMLTATCHWTKVSPTWTGYQCQVFVFRSVFFSFPNLVASMFTGFCCSLTFPLEREMSPHWKWSLSILSAHFFLNRWLVSLGNCIQLQIVYWNSRQQQTLSFCFKKKSSWIKYWQKRENKICTHWEWTAHGWNSDHTKSFYTQGHWKD